MATVTNGTTTHTTDLLGREIAYDDGAGNVTRSEYDNRGRKTKVTDSAPSTVTYDYDNPAGLPTRIHDSVMGTIGDVTGSYDSDGRLDKEVLPWNMNVEFDQKWVGLGLSVGCSFVSEGRAGLACATGAGAVTGWISYRYGTPKRKRHIGGYWASTWRGALDGTPGYSAGNGKKYYTGVRSCIRSVRTWWRGGHGRYTQMAQLLTDGTG